jgi:hypothetical protein
MSFGSNGTYLGNASAPGIGSPDTQAAALGYCNCSRPDLDLDLAAVPGEASHTRLAAAAALHDTAAALAVDHNAAGALQTAAGPPCTPEAAVLGTRRTEDYLDLDLGTPGLDAAAGPGNPAPDTAGPGRDSRLRGRVGFLRLGDERLGARLSRFAHLRSGRGHGGGGATWLPE